MYNDYLLQLEEAGKIRNLKQRTIDCYKNYVSSFLNYMNKNPEELTCQDVREFLLRKKEEGLKATTLNLYNSAIRFFFRKSGGINRSICNAKRLRHGECFRCSGHLCFLRL